MYMGSDGRVPAQGMPGLDEIAHSAASQRGREGRRKRWWKVCVMILVYFLSNEVFIMDTKKKELDSYGDFRKYSVEEISSMLGVGKTKTREMLQSRLLPVTKIGRDYFTSKTAIQEFLSDNVGKELFF